jgi:outer membrane protein
MQMTTRVSRLLCTAAAACGSLWFACGAHAQTLLEALEAARARDPALIAARAQAEATRERIGVVRAAAAPTLNASGGINRQYAEINSAPGQQVDGGAAALNLNVPLYRPQVGASVEQAGVASRAAQVQALATEQELLARVTLAYLEVLIAIDNLQAIGGQKTAVAAQLAAARRSFEVGTGTIVDPNEAQSRFDLIVAQEIAAVAELAIRRAALATLTGRSVETVYRLPLQADLPPVRPAVLDEWLERARNDSPAIRRARLEREVAEREIERRRLGARPGVDLVGSVGREVNPSVQFSGLRTNSASAGLQFSWPLYDGGAVSAGVREALALAGRASAEADGTRQNVELEIRRLFRRVGSGTAVVAALGAAERSASVTLRSMERALQVGVRVTTDVLNAQQQLFLTRRDLARARYEVLADLTRLRQAAGVLSAEDLGTLSALLTEPMPVTGR